MKNLKSILIFAVVIFSMTAFAGKDYKADYAKKVKVNDDTIGVIAGVINYVCPKLVAKSTKVCNAKDPVGSAVRFQKQLLGSGDIDDLDDMDDAPRAKAMKTRKILHVDAAMQFYDAVEQFKSHMPLRAKAKAFAKKKNYKDAALHEQMAWQYLVKCASRGIFTKKMVDGE